MKNLITTFVLLLSITFASSAQATIKIGKIKYGGGGDWYANKTALPNLINFCNKELKTTIFTDEDIVDLNSKALFQYPFLYLTGHGNVLFSSAEANNLREYLLAGGFLHLDDNYGMNTFIRREMKKVFPELDFIELPFSHEVYHQKFDFKNGLPKIHEHDNKPPQGYGLIYKGRLVCFFSYECDLGNGWEDQEVYGDPQEVRLQALKMGANLIQYAFTTY
jgi:Domain of unknown function (DUF4159)